MRAASIGGYSLSLLTPISSAPSHCAVARRLLWAPGMKQYLAPFLALLTACVAAPTETPDTLSDPTASSAPFTRGPRPQLLTPIAIQTDVAPHLVLFREGTGPWRPAQRLKATTYEAMVSGPYTVAVLCSLEHGPYTTLTSKTLQDELLVQSYCTFEELPLLVSGTMVQPGMVNLGNAFASSRTPSWTWELPAFPGAHDLVAASADHLLILRNLAVTGDRSLPPLDLAQQGVALVNAPVTVTNPFPGETLGGLAVLRTPHASQSIIYRGTLPAKLPPGAALGPRDRLDLSVRSQISDGNTFTFRSAKRQVFNAAPTPVTLWDPVAGLQMGVGSSGDVQASWTSLQPHDTVSLLAYDNLGVSIEHLVSASYLAASGAHQIVLSTDAPGFDDAWHLDLSSYSRSFFVLREGATRTSFQHDEYDLSAAAAGTSASIERLRDLTPARSRLTVD